MSLLYIRYVNRYRYGFPFMVSLLCFPVYGFPFMVSVHGYRLWFPARGSLWCPVSGFRS